MAKFINIVLLIVWLVIIFIFSCENGENSKSTSISVTDSGVNIANKITGNKISSLFEKKLTKDYLGIIRKSAHFIEYFILGIICFLLFRQYGFTDSKCILFSFLICFVYACSDEIHQLFVPGRTSRVFDVFIDSLGSFTGIMFLQLVMKIKTILF